MSNNVGRGKDMTGIKVGRLTVDHMDHREMNSSGRWEIYWYCNCECGNHKIVSTSTLTSAIKNNRMISCGCYVSERAGNLQKTHGLRRTRLSRIHNNICDRCFNPNNKRYPDWGGRGIKVCDEWYTPGVPGNPGLVNFYNWATKEAGYVDPAPDAPQSTWPTLDRIDNDKGYSPDNCRFVSYKDQAMNRRNTRRIYDGSRWWVHSELEDYAGWARATINSKQCHGWSDNAIVYAAQHPEFKLYKLHPDVARKRCVPKDTYVDKDGFIHLIPIIHIPEE